MKRTGILILCLIVLIFPFIFTGCSEDVDYNAIIIAQVKPVESRVTELEKARGSLETRIKAQEDRQFPAAQDLSLYTKRSDVPKSFYDYLDNLTSEQITAIKTKLGITGTTPTNPANPTTIPQATTGQVSYTVLNAQQWYTFNTQGIIAVRITNGKSDSRYVRPQLTMTIYPSSTTPAVLTNATCVVTSNSQGQPAIVYGSAGQGTPITSWSACQQLLFIPTSGGMLAGQYLLGSGQAMDIYMTVTITPAYPGLWTLNVSGTDVSISGI
jgi:hypothetical protein